MGASRADAANSLPIDETNLTSRVRLALQFSA
jgi:hypothetical protein